MNLSQVEDQAIQARIALIVGAKTFDRLFVGIKFDEADGPLHFRERRGDCGSDRRQSFRPHREDCLWCLEAQIDIVVVLPKVLQ